MGKNQTQDFRKILELIFIMFTYMYKRCLYSVLYLEVLSLIQLSKYGCGI